MAELTLFKVQEGEEITSEDVSRDDLAREVQNAPEGAWARDQDWPVLFANVRDEAGDEATLVVPFDDPRAFEVFLEDAGIQRRLVEADFDMELLEEIEEELA